MTENPETDLPATEGLVPSGPSSTVRHTIERRPGSIAVLSVEVDADRLTRATDRVFQRHVRQARIPGFRPGKAPRSLYERTYGTEHLWAEAAEDVVDETYREIVQAERLDPLDSPAVELGQLEPGKPLTFTATLPVRPEVNLGEYGSEPPVIDVKMVTDDDVSSTIERMRKQHAELKVVEREAKEGDIVTIDVDLVVDGGEPTPWGRAAHVELGPSFSVPGFVDGLVGVKGGEERTLTLAFPGDYADETLRGKTGVFGVKTSAVSESILPALDNDFAKTAGVADLAALDRAVRSELAHAAFHEARDAAADKLIDHLNETATVEVPEVLAHAELDHLIEDLKHRVESRGVRWEMFLLEARKTEEELHTEFKAPAERRAKSLLVLDAVAVKEGVTVSGDELAREVALTPIAQQDPQALRDPRVLASLARSMRNRKVVDKLLGLEGPDAERVYLKAAGAPDDLPEPAPQLIVPAAKPATTSEGRDALRKMIEGDPPE